MFNWFMLIFSDMYEPDPHCGLPRLSKLGMQKFLADGSEAFRKLLLKNSSNGYNLDSPIEESSDSEISLDYENRMCSSDEYWI